MVGKHNLPFRHLMGWNEKTGGSMNKEQVSGKVDQAVGKVKQGVGEAVNNQKLANQGIADQVKGAAKETWGNAKDAATDIAKDNQKHSEDHARNVRENISDKVENVKNRVNEKIDVMKEEHREHEKEKHRTA
jgi:uncharacterized protein YjbJ (UPF0337 family)